MYRLLAISRLCETLTVPMKLASTYVGLPLHLAPGCRLLKLPHVVELQQLKPQNLKNAL